MWARQEQGRDPDKAEKYARSCIDKLEEAFKIDPSVKELKLDGATAFNAAYRAYKHIDAAALIAGQKGADDCRTNQGRLTSLYLESGKPYWDSGGKVFRSISGHCYEKGSLNFSSSAVLTR